MKKLLFTLVGLALILTSCTKEESVMTADGLTLANSNGTGFVGGIDPNNEQYNTIVENPFVDVADEPTSTFSIDADGGSYSNVRRFLNDGQLPPVDAIRTEELLNYFTLDYPGPTTADPIGLNGEVSACPWDAGHKLVRIGIKGAEISKEDMPNANFVLLVDVSGSMSSENKLPLLRDVFKMFADELRAQDRVAIVTYAGQSEVVLPSTSGTDKSTIKAAIDQLGAGGGTAGAQGILTAYDIAQQYYIEGGNNRIILATDGDFNIGVSSRDDLVDLIKDKRDEGVFLTAIGVGTGNLNDAMMERVANNGNGNYEYMDSYSEGVKILSHEYTKLLTVAQDVKVQVTFNANNVESYRLIGYENRLLENHEFEDDSTDAGEIGANQTITALYEIVPTSVASKDYPTFEIDFRYKLPLASTSNPMSLQVYDEDYSFTQASENMRFAAGVAGFGLILRDSDYKGNWTYDDVLETVGNASTFDPNGYRSELHTLVAIARGL